MPAPRPSVTVPADWPHKGARMRIELIAFRPRVFVKAGRQKMEWFIMKGGDHMAINNSTKLIKLHVAIEGMIQKAAENVDRSTDARTTAIFQARLEALQEVQQLLTPLIWD